MDDDDKRGLVCPKLESVADSSAKELVADTATGSTLSKDDTVVVVVVDNKACVMEGGGACLEPS